MGIAHRCQAWLGLTNFDCLYRSCWTRRLRTTTLSFLTAVASLSLRLWSHSSLTPPAASIWRKTSLSMWASLWREALAAALVSPLPPPACMGTLAHAWGALAHARAALAHASMSPYQYDDHLVLNSWLGTFNRSICSKLHDCWSLNPAFD